MRRSFVFALVAALALTAGCGGRSDGEGSRPRNLPVRDIPLPTLDRSMPAFTIAGMTFDEDDVALVEGLEGVEVVAPAALTRLDVKGPGKNKRLRVAAVDSLAYRGIAPGATRDADFVWSSLLAGEAVTTFDTADSLGLDGRNDSLEVGGTRPLVVGAFADNGIPNFADVVVDRAYGKRYGLTGQDLLFVGATDNATIGRIGDSLTKLFPRADIRRMLPPDLISAGDPAPVGSAQGGVIGQMSYTVLDNGFIRPDGAWVASNIATGEVPILGRVTCHRLMFPQLRAAFQEIADKGLAGEIDPGDYGGCYVPRFIDRDPSRALSMHAFGLAIDLNVSTNGMHTAGDMHPEVVHSFEKWGFEWGGRWQNPVDPMHFELRQLIEP